MTENQPKAGLIPWPPIGDLLGDILFAAGWVALFAVAALWFTAIRIMIRAKTTLNPNGVPDHLVTSGPFGITRNPMYLANTLLLIGVAFVSGIAWFLPLAFIAAFATQKIAIEGEEKVLATKFGKKYRDYAKRVRRWI
jgi:protein-S-isoprenylcysteine O-methyltransferase Ste14